MTNETSSAQQICEDYLREQIRSNNEKGILRSENQVAEKLLARSDEVAHIYEEVYSQLCEDGIAWKTFLGCVLSTGAFWSPEKIAKYRGVRNELVEVNLAIAKHAHVLADLLNHRTALNNESAFSSDTHYHICDVVTQASAGNGLYRSWVKDPLSHLRSQFDLKYWPSLDECVRAIGEDANNAKVDATDPLTEAATKSTRPSKADFLRALLASIKENRGDHLGDIPENFRPSDEALASLVIVLLDLPSERIVDATYVKNLRLRDSA